jgi:cyclophilin family peptidyl-prolyl cis-trans isomerase
VRGAAALALAAIALAGCGGGSSASAPTTAPAPTHAEPSGGGCTSVPAPPAKARTRRKPSAPLAAAKRYDAVVRTNCGSFTIRLDVRSAPHATASFVALARSGFFDRTTFHRIVPGFVIQGGDPTATGTGGPGYSTVDRPPANAAYTMGVVAMAKTQAQAPGTAGSQFFVVTGAGTTLPPDYAILGKVVHGLDVVERIGRLGDQAEQPTRTVEIEHVSVSVK